MTAPKKSQPDLESGPKGKSAEVQGESELAPPNSIDNIAKFFGGRPAIGRPGSLARPAMEVHAATGATGLRKGDRVRHAKYGEGVVMMREGDGEDAKLSVVFERHGLKKLMEKFANLRKV
jgi:DNA helicase-2/ATP-dependent DNA helicase PcrA